MQQANGQRTMPGTIALVGSGEYTDAMNTTDRYLLDTIIGTGKKQVIVLPTASGLEQGMPQRWNDMGVKHFEALGADVTSLMLVTRADANHPDVVATMRHADLYYFSGGNPQYVVETLRDTPAWDALVDNYEQGAVIAGCSAGAMMLGSYTLNVRAAASGQPPQWPPAFGLVSGIAVLPHFDRVAGFIEPDTFQQMLASTPEGTVVIGVDEDTALVRHAVPNQSQWMVMGRQTVSVFRDGERVIYEAGATLEL